MSLSTFQIFLKSLKTHSLLDASIANRDYIHLDLSVDNTALKGVDMSSSDDLEAFIWNYMKRNNAKVAYGGYLEKRGIYERSSYFNQVNAETQRNIHLGMDIWIKANTPIFAPLAGTIHSFKNNTNYGDYGPTIILEHQIESQQFFTLYGHLSLASIQDLKVGVEVKPGEQIATLGTSDINGEYPPHLHFQVIKEIQNFEGDYPGVCNQLDLGFYKGNCLDPNLLLKLY